MKRLFVNFMTFAAMATHDISLRVVVIVTEMTMETVTVEMAEEQVALSW